MPYVTDQDISHGTWTSPDGFSKVNQVSRRRTQYGYRSRGQVNDFQQMLEASPATVRAFGNKGAIDPLDRLYSMTRGTFARSDSTTVHERRYNESFTPLFETSWMRTNRRGEPYERRMGATWFTLSASDALFPASDSAARAMASERLRSIRPTRPDFDLARFVGELKDFKSLFSKSNYSPTSPKGVGSSYLNYQFGIMPTVSDVISAAKAVLKSDSIVRDFAERSAREYRRRSSIHLDTYETTVSPRNNIVGGQTRVTTSLRGCQAGMHLSGNRESYYSRQPRIGFTMSVSYSIDTFGTFEYYVGDPNGYVSRMDAYKAAARKILGGGLTASLIYELTPFSWMVDWFYDIGGLLAYQQDVADLGLVSKRAGFTKTTRVSVTPKSVPQGVSMSSTNTNGTSALNILPFGRAISSHRQKGGPYSMSPTAELNDFQLSILGALGLTYAPGKLF